ncbi:hypothetical protein OHB26_24725 [Nocardia sp. NBC_01503]|uniref:hypothetical protein n=1 Tax=Nocardia sp. NBC_01503 TaxID=2975997 RepID=UPI002E7BD6DA|nr:hypothetical protein [Nocardia sp. NBC_01503]WTL30145.1 hypothetical protein OHB26_24725 [Nocardia sp. NBC_01503]
MNDNGRGIDWDGELQALMESSGIDPTQMTRPTWIVRVRRTVLRARAGMAALLIVGLLMWLTAASGAPAAATVPLRIWLMGWIGYGLWISLGRPDWSTAFHTTREFAMATSQSVSRFAFAHSRPVRARWRAWKAVRDRDDTVPTTA